MLLDLSRIRTPLNRYDRQCDASAFEPDDAFRVVEPVVLGFDIHKDKRNFRLAGNVKTTLELPCSRCLDGFTWPIDAAFDLRFQPRGETAPAEGETEIEEDDLSTSYYDNDTIDLSQLMREQFLLALPMKPLCNDACHGLCSVCGTNLNRGTCDCKRDWDDPRLAALKNLRQQN